MTLQGLLDYCKENPADDTSRLILADWLEENGQPQRAEYVRLQLLSKGNVYPNWYPGQVVDKARELRLQKKNVRLWTNASLHDGTDWFHFDNNAGGPAGRFERGTIRLYCALTELPSVFERLPNNAIPWLEHLDFGGFEKTDALETVLRMPEMHAFTSFGVSSAEAAEAGPVPDVDWLDQKHIRSLDLNGNGTGPVCSRLATASALRPFKLSVSPDPNDTEGWRSLMNSPVLSEVRSYSNSVLADSPVLATLARAPHLARLERLSLDLFDFYYSAESLTALFNSPNLTNLADLRVIGFSGPVHGIGPAIAESKVIRKLQTLDLGFNVVSTEDAVVLACSPALDNLRSLSFSSGAITDAGVVALADSPHLCRLEILDLSCTGISDVALTAIANSPNLRKLRRLYVCRCAFTERGVRALASSPFLTELEDLDLALNSLAEGVLDALASSTTLGNLRSLRIGNNNVHADSFARLMESAVVRQVETLSLSILSADQARALAGSPALTSLRKITLNEAQLQRGEINALMDAPWLPAIVELNLSRTGLDDEGIQKMTSRLRPGSLANLAIGENSSISDLGARALLEWPGLQHLVDLSLYGTQIQPALQQQLKKVVVNPN